MARPTELFPEVEPNYKGYHYTDDGHQVYYERCGNPKGKPITYVPGGPGAGLDPKARRFFDPDKWDALLVELRGSGKSKPLGKIENNNTQFVAKDIYDINRSLGREKTALFGGSWGSTLCSFSAITYPQMVLGLILRGIFLGEKVEIDDTYIKGVSATSEYGKKAFDRFMSHASPDYTHDPVGYFYHQMQPESPRHRRMYFAYEWARFEECLLYKNPLPEEEIEKSIKSIPYEAWALMETHYFANGCFMEDGFIIKNANKIPKVPVVIIQGKDDMICPPKHARRLHEALPDSKLLMVEGGHSSSEPEILKALVSETDALFDRI